MPDLLRIEDKKIFLLHIWRKKEINELLDQITTDEFKKELEIIEEGSSPGSKKYDYVS